MLLSVILVHHGEDTLNLEKIISQIPGIDPRNINITSINIKTCVGMEEQLTLLNRQLQQTTLRNNQLDGEVFELKREVRLLNLKLSTCSATASAGSYQTQLHNKMKQLLETFDSNAFLLLKIMAITREVDILQKKVKLASNSTESNTELIVLQKKLQEKISDLNLKKEEIKRSHPNSALILQILSLQNQIWDLEQTESKSLQPDRSIRVLELISVHTKIAVIERIITFHIEKSRINAADNQRLWKEKIELLKRKILQLNRDENNSELTLQTLLQTKQREYAKAQIEIKELQMKLQLKSKECSGHEERFQEVKYEYEQKIAELNRTGDYKTALVLNVINLHEDLNALKDLISTTEDPDRISELKNQLEEKQDKLLSMNADIDRLIANSGIILTIIELQDEIRGLQKKAANETTQEVKELQNRVQGLISQMDYRDHKNIKILLKILILQSQVRHLSELQTLQRTEGISVELTNELAAKKKQLQKYVSEVNERNQSDAKLILTITNLHNRLRNIEKGKYHDAQTTSTISDLKEQLKAKEEKHSRDQAEIKVLQTKLNQTEAQCSSVVQKLKDLQNDLDDKMKELQSKSDSVTSLALQVSTLTVQLEELKKQLQNTEFKTKIQELQKIIEEKNKELEKKTEELKARSAQPQRILQIIAIQTEIEKLVNVATNDTVLQDQLNYLIDGIQDENNENTKLMFQMLAQQDEIARLKKQGESQTQAQLERIKELENDLEDIRSQIKEKTRVLDSSDLRIANLTTQIMELHKKVKPLEEEISALKQENAESVAVMEIAELRAQLKAAQIKTPKEKNIKELEKQLLTQQRENRNLKSTNKDLKQEVEELKMCCNVNNDCEDLESQLQQSQQDTAHLQRSLEEQMTENNKLQLEYSNLERQLKQSQVDNDYLQQELKKRDVNLTQQHEMIEELIVENHKLQDAYKNLENEKNKLEHTVQELQNKLTEVEDKTIYAKRVILDPDTAHPRLALSADNTQITTTDVQNIPDNPGRFDVSLAVLGSTGFSTGRHYWEVSVAGRLCYQVGMAGESAPRRGTIITNPANSYWTILLNKQGQYKAIDRRSVIIPVKTQPLTLGILLNYKEGQISFYDAGARSHMYSFVGQRFTEKIYPFIHFCVDEGTNKTPIVLLPPGSTDWIN
ncbi:hypothetical protein PAMP_004442 [Pampus punctatissimus]